MSKILDTIFSPNKYLSIMKIQINETTIKEVEIKLTQPKYVCYCGVMFYKFHEEGENIVTTKFDFSDNSTYPFSLQVTTNLNMDSFNADGENYRIITGSEYYGKLQELLAKYSITHITPEFDAPTLFLQEENSITDNHLNLQT